MNDVFSLLAALGPFSPTATIYFAIFMLGLRMRQLLLFLKLPTIECRVEIAHHFLELREVQRLRPVADCLLRLGMHFHD
jgi:hypothetical protein